MVRGKRLEVIGAVKIGGAVDVAGAVCFQVMKVLLGPDVLRALEHHVFEQVGEAGAPGAFVRGTDVVPQVDRDQGKPVILRQDHLQPVLQSVFFIFDLRRGNRRSGVSGQAAETEENRHVTSQWGVPVRAELLHTNDSK